MEANIIGFRTGEKNGIQYVIVFFTYSSKSVTGKACASALVSASYADMLKLADRVCCGFNRVTHKPYLYIPKE